MVRMTLATKLKDFRIQAGLTINDVGEKIGKSGKTVSAWECGRGQPDADMLLTLCELYGVGSIAEFYGEPLPSLALSEAEKRLLAMFRELNPQGQDYIFQTLGMATQVYKKRDCIPNMEENIG